MAKKAQLPSLFDGLTTDGWAEFWRLYPRKVGTDYAEKCYRKVIETGRARHDVLIAGLRCYIPLWEQKIANGEKHLIPHASTWLNQGRWKDDVEGEIGNGERPATSAERRGDDRQDRIGRYFSAARSLADGQFK